MEDSVQPPVAVIGMGCRFPGAHDVEAYRRLLFEGRCAIGPLPAHRFDQARYFDPRPGTYGKSYTRLGGWIEDTPFDPHRFGLPPGICDEADPAHRWALEVAAATLADAGLEPERLRGSNTAVVIGHSRGSTRAVDGAFATAAEELAEELERVDSLSRLSAAERAALRAEVVAAIRTRYPRVGGDGGPGLITSAVAGLIAGVFGWTGRHLVVDAACASSLAALDVAWRALRRGSVDLALVGGLSFSQESSVIMFAQSRALSADGSFPFDARANGFISSDGVGMLLLARLGDARAHGWRVRALVRGVGGSCDGSGKALWAPRKEGQVLSMQRALASAGVDPRDIGMVEAHGTSTALGDATEVAAISEVLGPRLPAGAAIPIGSVKGNIGHCREAAGMAGLVKALIALEEERIPPSIGYETPNPDIHWERTPLRHAGAGVPWPRNERPRVALVNSFGIGGLNYEAVLEEPPVAAPDAPAVFVPRPFRPVAVVGIGLVLPGASRVADLWERLCAGERALSDVPATRWSAGVYHAPEAGPWRTCARAGGFVEGYTPDWKRYKMPPALVAGTDPLQFMILDSALGALADAGIDLASADRRRISVIVGSEFGSDYALALSLALRVPELSDAVAAALRRRGYPEERAAAAAGELAARVRERLPRVTDDSSGSFSSSTLASRVAKTLDLQGPSYAVDAACASSLASLEAACEALADGDCDTVLYGGGDRSLRVQRFETYSRWGCLSRSGRGVPFDAEADGFLPGEGAAVCALRRLDDARAAGQRVYAVVRGVGSATDGEWKPLHAPSARGLARAMARAYASSGVAPARVAFLEAHGAGTPAVDAAEIEAARETFRAAERREPLLLGSVKANVGHMQGAAGVAALVKAALSLHHGTLPPLAGFRRPGHLIDAGFEVPTAPRPLGPGPLWAGVSAMGFGGINYHAVLESGDRARAVQAPSLPAGSPAREPVVVRAASRAALADALERLERLPAAEALAPGASWGTGAVALGQPPGDGSGERLARARSAVAASGGEAALAGQGIALVEGAVPPGLCVLFPGQGSQYAGMLREVVSAYPRARAKLDELDGLLAARGLDPLSKLMWDSPERMAGVRGTQLAVLGAGLVMAEVAASHGLAPGLVTGHSYGEYPALVAAGALSADAAIELTVRRCRAIEEAAAPGAMLSVLAGMDRVAGLLEGLPGPASPANVNSREQVVVAGDRRALDALAVRCAAARIETRLLDVPGAFHSPLMRPAADLFAAGVEAGAFGVPRLRFLSSVGPRERATPGQVREALVEQLTAPVDFVRQIEAAYAAGFGRFVEVGPGSVLSRLAASILAGRPAVTVSLDDRKRPGVGAVERALAALRASEPGAGRPLPAPIPASEGAELFPPAEWAELSRRPGWADFWRDTRPSLQVFARDLFDRRPAAAAKAGASRILFLDATAKRLGRAGAPAPPAETGRAEPTSPAPSAPAVGASAVREFLLQEVLRRTGYPPELVGFDLDMEADLGIDSVKQAQILGAMRERFDLSTDDRLSLRDFPTLGHIAAYVERTLGSTEPPAAPRPETPAAGATALNAAAAVPAAAEPTTPVLRLRGTPYEIGLAHGRSQRDAIRRILDSYEAYLGREGVTHGSLQGALARPEDYFDADALEEVRGLAEACGVPERHLLAYNLDSVLFPAYGAGCTQAGLAARANGAAHGVVHAVNEDSPLALLLSTPLTRVVQVREPRAGHAHVLFSQAGQVGGLNGVNRGGLVVSSAVLLDRSGERPRPGLLHPLLVRTLLQRAGSTSEAVALARALDRTGAWSVLLSHSGETRLRAFEYEGETLREAAGLARHLTANHCVLEAADARAPEHSRHRLARLRELVEAAGGAAGPEELKSALTDRFDAGRGRVVAHRTMNTVSRVDNVMALVVDTTGGRLWFTDRVAGGADPAWQELRWEALLEEPKVEVIDPAALPAPNGAPHDGPAFGRYVLRMEPSPLPPDGRPYRPSRAVLIGEGAISAALAARLAARGCAVTTLPLECPAADADAAFDVRPLPDVFLLSGVARAGATGGDVVALAEDWPRERTRLIEGPYVLLQAWLRRLRDGDRPVLAAVTALGGGLGLEPFAGALPEGGAVLGLLKALRREFPSLRVKALDGEPRERPEVLAEALLRELDSADTRLEVALRRGQRRVVRLVASEARRDPARVAELEGLRSVVLTGGARGITAEIAVALARAGVRRLHLLGRTPLDPRVEEWRGLDESGRQAVRREVLARLRAERGGLTPVEWQEARAAMDRALEIDRTRRRIAAEGATARYHVVDVSDRPRLDEVLRRIRDEDGPIEAVVHGAGTEHSRGFLAKTVAELRATLAPKVDGLLNLAALTARDPVSLFVGFSSVSGRFGGLGQADYALASDLLSRLMGGLAVSRPQARAFAIAWPAWDDVGMAVRGETRARLLSAGQSLLPAAEGARRFVEEVLAAGCEPEVTFAGKLDGLDVDRLLPPPAAAWSEAARFLPLADVVVEVTRERVATECWLDAARDAFLREHRGGGTPILPAVAALELLAETAGLAAGAPVELMAVNIHAPLKLLPGRRLRLGCEGTRAGAEWALKVTADVVAREGGLLEPDRTLVTARAALAPAPVDGWTDPGRLEGTRVDFRYPEEGDERTASPIHHGPPFRGLREVVVGGGEWHEALVVAPPARGLRSFPEGAEWAVPAAALDCCLQACGVVARARFSVAALPVAVGRLRLGRPPRDREPCRAVLRLRGRDGRTVRFDIVLLGEEGDLLLHVEDYQAGAVTAVAAATPPPTAEASA